MKGCGKIMGIAEEDFCINCGGEMDDGRIYYCPDCSQNLNKGKKSDFNL